MFAGSGLGEEGVERVVPAPDGLVGRHLAIRLDAMLQTVQLPAGIAHLFGGRKKKHLLHLTERCHSSSRLSILDAPDAWLSNNIIA